MTHPNDPRTQAVDLPSPCVVLCPPWDADGGEPSWYGSCRDELTAHGMPFVTPSTIQVSHGDDSWADVRRRRQTAWVATVGRAISAGASGRPLVVVATGEAVHGLPALALSQRSARHSVVGYVVVDADLTMPLDAPSDWPGAPVTYVRTPEAAELGWRVASLRGWRPVAGDPVAATIAAVALAGGAGNALG